MSMITAGLELLNREVPVTSSEFVFYFLPFYIINVVMECPADEIKYFVIC
jgi:hypothetical protein